MTTIQTNNENKTGKYGNFGDKIVPPYLSKTDKYGDDSKYESWADNKIFFPVADKLVDPLRTIKLTPNMVTIISTILTTMTIYFLIINNKVYAMITYLLGYLLDCVDGKMARKYNMSSDFGMALDMVSDNITNMLLVLYLIATRDKTQVNKVLFITMLILTFLLSLSYGINEAVSSQEATGSDNFYERRVKQLTNVGTENEKKLYNMFLFITNISYKSYRLLFPTFNKEKIDKWLNIIKHFGPGNYCLFMTAVIAIS